MGLIGFLVAWFAKKSSIEVVKFFAYKAVLMFAVVMMLPKILIAVWYDLKIILLGYIDTFLLANFPDAYFNSGLIQLTGLAAYLADSLCLAQGVTILISCTMAGFIIRLMR